MQNGKDFSKKTQSFIEQAENDFNKGAETVNNLIKELENVAPISSIGDVRELILNPAKYIVSKMDLKSNELTKQFADVKILELLESPKPLSIRKKVTEIVGDFTQKRQVETALKLGVLETGTLKKDPVKFEVHSIKGNIYAVSKREKEIFQAISRVLEALEFINKSVETGRINRDITSIPFAEWSGYKERFELNEYWFKTHVSE